MPRPLQPYVRWIIVAIVALVLLAAVTAARLRNGESHLPQASAEPTPAGPARNGLIAYSYEGDIYVGDPVTAETTAIVTNPEYEVNPVFSPDGERIALIRGNPQTGASTIVVVRADGSDERVVLPKGRTHRGFGGVVWTPDSASLVVQLDRPPFTTPISGRELSLFDSFGSGREQVLARLAPLFRCRILALCSGRHTMAAHRKNRAIASSTRPTKAATRPTQCRHEPGGVPGQCLCSHQVTDGTTSESLGTRRDSNKLRRPGARGRTSGALGRFPALPRPYVESKPTPWRAPDALRGLAAVATPPADSQPKLATDAAQFVFSCRVYQSKRGFSGQPDEGWVRSALMEAVK